MASVAESDSESVSSSSSSVESLQLVSPLVSAEDVRHPDKWMSQGNNEENREPYPASFRDGLRDMGMATESFVDTCRAIATTLEITNEVSPSVLRIVDRQSRLFPSNLHLNNRGEEPPRVYMSSRGNVWRRIMSCMDESMRPNYYLLNRLNAADFNYTNG